MVKTLIKPYIAIINYMYLSSRTTKHTFETVLRPLFQVNVSVYYIGRYFLMIQYTPLLGDCFGTHWYRVYTRQRTIFSHTYRITHDIYNLITRYSALFANHYL